jgi:hypothetical protein
MRQALLGISKMLKRAKNYRPVDQVQVEIVGTKHGKRLVECGLNVLRCVEIVPKLLPVSERSN